MDISDNTSPQQDDNERKKENRKTVIKDFILVALLVIAVIIGIGMGVGLKDHWTEDDKRKIFYLKFPGQLLLNMLKVLT